jgi:predicted acyltransferase (DUF342 family)
MSSDKQLIFSGTATIADISTDKDIKTSGFCKIEGNIESNGFKSSGRLSGTGNILAHGYFKNSGSMNLVGSIFTEDKAVLSGTTKIDGNLEAKRSLVSSGSLRISGKLNAISQVKISGSTKIGEDLTVNGILIVSGSLGVHNVRVRDYINSYGSMVVLDNIKSDKIVDISGKLNCGGNISGESVLIDYKRKIKRFIFSKFPYSVGGSVYARDLVNIDRTIIHGDIKAQNIIIGQHTQVDGTIYYVEDCIIHDKANIKNKPVKINLEDL